ncbi:MAG: hypothetical protein FJ319_04515 [SAR202 cluster bacterium]|nr:hypothetical protein [SAR202 cluster bacterium]
MLSLTAIAGRTWVFSHAIGRTTVEHNGNTGGYIFPCDFTLAPNETLYVLSRGYDHETFPDTGVDLSRRVGKVGIDQFHYGDFGRNSFVWPSGIAYSKDDKVYVADEFLNKVLIFAPERFVPFPDYIPGGEHIGEWGIAGGAPGELNAPVGINFDANNDLYVVDSRNHRVQKFSSDGKYIRSFGSEGTGPGQLKKPWGLTIDRAGDVYVADWGNNRVQKFTADGKHIATFGSTAEDGGDLNHPSDVAVDADGDVYVTDWGNRRVQIYEKNGDIIGALYGDASTFSKAAEVIVYRDPETIKGYYRAGDLTPMARFGRPLAVQADDKGRIIVSDQRNRLHVYTKHWNYTQPRINL